MLMTNLTILAQALIIFFVANLVYKLFTSMIVWKMPMYADIRSMDISLSIVQVGIMVFALVVYPSAPYFFESGESNPYGLMGNYFRPWVNYMIAGYFLAMMLSQAVSWSVELFCYTRMRKDPYKLQAKLFWFERWLGRKVMFKLENDLTYAVACVWLVIIFLAIR